MQLRSRFVRVGIILTCLVLSGCARRAPTAKFHRQEEPVATPADAPPRPRPPTYANGELPPGWQRYVQRKTIPLGKAVTAGPAPYARVKLVEVWEEDGSAIFEASHLVDRRRGRVKVGGTFHVFTPIFGRKGATLESLDASGATVVFRWTQSASVPVPPGAVAQADVGPPAR